METPLEKDYIALERRLGFYFGRLLSCPVIPPDHVYFTLTNRCNLSCIMCDVSKNPADMQDELPTLKVKDIILQIKDMGVKHLIFSGGEPLLRKDLLEIVEFAIAQNIGMVDIITNGTLLDGDIIRRLIKLKLYHITFSLDGLEENNDIIRGKGAFARSVSNMDKFNFLKSKYASAFPSVGINFTIMDRNIEDMLAIIDFARVKKCNIVVFQPALFNNTKMHENKINTLWPSRDKIHRLKDIVEKIADMKDALDGLYICTEKTVLKAIPYYFRGISPGADFKCYEGIKRIVITSNGRLWSCSGEYGDLNRNNIKDIWFSEEATKVRQEAKRCKTHCLQDCVYFPSNILEEVLRFLNKSESINDDKKEKIREKLFRTLDGYIKSLYLQRKIFAP